LFYGDLYDILFKNVSANMKASNIEEIHTTFMNGGYYRFDLDSEVSVLSVNSIVINNENNQ